MTRTVGFSKWLAGLALIAGVAGVTSGAAGATTKPKTVVPFRLSAHAIASGGGRVVVQLNAPKHSICKFSVSPAVAGFDHPEKCSGTVKRDLSVPTNHASSVRVYRVTGVVTTGKTSRRYVQLVREAGAIIAPVATTATPTSAINPSGASTPAGNSGTVTTTQTSTPTPSLAVSLDPTFTQSTTNWLEATFTFSASASIDDVQQQSLPAGVLEMFADGSLSQSINVGGSVSGGQADVTFSQYGDHTVDTVYVSGTNSATSGNESVTIEPPNETVDDTFGTTAPTTSLNSSVQVTGSTAQVSVTDANWEGATNVGLTDQLGDTCTAAISGTTATCSMPVTGTPTSLMVSYPGGTPTVGTQAVAPNGTQQVTTDWPAVSGVTISGSSLTVQVNSAEVAWASWAVQGGGSGSSNPPNPINTSTGKYVHLFVSTTGNVYPDGSVCDYGVEQDEQEPCGYLVFTITGGPSSDYTEINEYFGSPDCSMSQNYSGQAEGGCDITFNTAGTYYVSVEYIATDYDANYANTTIATTEEVNVS